MAIKKATIVLEGGATRGIFTSGVLDCLMEKEIYMSDVIGVTAGASMHWIMYQSRDDLLFLDRGYLPQKYLTACFVKRFLSASSKYGIIKSKSASAETFAFKSSG